MMGQDGLFLHVPNGAARQAKVTRALVVPSAGSWMDAEKAAVRSRLPNTGVISG